VPFQEEDKRDCKKLQLKNQFPVGVATTDEKQ